MTSATGARTIKRIVPDHAGTIVNYINDLADYAKTATIRRRISALSENFNAAGLTKENPAKRGSYEKH